MTDIKLCKDCKHSPPFFVGGSDSRAFYDFAECNHEMGSAINLVNGASYKHSCSSMRYDNDFCGDGGVYFELKQQVKEK